MNRRAIATGVLALLSICLIVYGTGFRSRYILTVKAREDVLLGRYHLALEGLEKARNSGTSGLLGRIKGEDKLLEYNIGVVLTLLGENKEAGVRFHRASNTRNPVLKARAIYNEANILAQELDFVNAAQGYIKVLEINPDDFQAKKNLERMRIGAEQFSSLFSPEREEKEERVEALKLMPWGNRYKYSGEQKLRW